MRCRYMLGLSSATILLFLSMTGCDKLNIPGGGMAGSPMAEQLAAGAIKASPPSTVATAIPPSTLARLGNVIYDWEVKRREKEDDPNVTAQMHRIFQRLKEVALADPTYGAVAKEMDWKLNTIRDKEIVMADAYPGGGVAIYNGVFTIAENEGALAAILGHEMAHVLARHELNRMTGDVAATAMTVGSAIASGTMPDKMDPKVIGPVAGALGIGYIFGVRQPWQRANELEADCLGLLLAAKAGYDPEKINGFWRRMNNDATKANDSYQFLNDHPINENRITHIKTTCLSPAQKVYDQVESVHRQDASATLPDVAG